MPFDSSIPDDWHSLLVRVPFPSAEHAVKVKRVIDVDGELRPEISRRQLSVEDKELVLAIRAATIAQARVALDHTFSDIQLVIQTMRRFAKPSSRDASTAEGTTAAADETPSDSVAADASMEVGLRGAWESIKK